MWRRGFSEQRGALRASSPQVNGEAGLRPAGRTRSSGAAGLVQVQVEIHRAERIAAQ